MVTWPAAVDEKRFTKSIDLPPLVKQPAQRPSSNRKAKEASAYQAAIDYDNFSLSTIHSLLSFFFRSPIRPFKTSMIR
ncbi:hypothetical protein T08_2031 [Trichinella sp. T8]|nr:hypothetical protein T08_2031 [Trichinella sp. T8]